MEEAKELSAMPGGERAIQTDQAARDIERLLQFGIRRGLLDPLDSYAARNALLELLRIAEPYGGEVAAEEGGSAPELLAPLLDYAAAAGILEADSATFRDLLDARIMGCLMPRPSEVASRFEASVRQEGAERATEDFYRLCINSNYIRMDRVASNRYWLTSTEYGDLEITVNVSKPEKDPKEIALLKAAPQSRYPKCLLCIDNVGYPGALTHPARQNLRVIPLRLAGEPWFLQYSPYVYYNEHSIIFDQIHRPMKLSRLTFVRLLDFIDQLPHYFIGSNADLPIVGGSILNHDHFQGGRHRFAMEKAPVERRFRHPEYPAIQLGIVRWPMSVIRMASPDKVQLLKLADEVYTAWQGYSDLSRDIAAFTEAEPGGTLIPHNTITPIARKNAAGEYELDLVLRNNRTSAEHPDGIFHPHRELHHIKKENIGLIEVMGLAVLPGRLKEELELLEHVLTGKLSWDERIRSHTEHPLFKHADWIETLIAREGTALTERAAADLVQREVGRIFAEVLRDAGVYKRNPDGFRGFELFLESLGFSMV